MTLDEAIENCQEIAAKAATCPSSVEHLQLAGWLSELQRLRKGVNLPGKCGKSLSFKTIIPDHFWFMFLSIEFSKVREEFWRETKDLPSGTEIKFHIGYSIEESIR